MICCLVAKSCLNPLATLWTVAHQSPLSIEFSSKEYWRGLPFPSPKDLPNSEIKLISRVLAGGCFTTEPPGDSQH